MSQLTLFVPLSEPGARKQSFSYSLFILPSLSAGEKFFSVGVYKNCCRSPYKNVDIPELNLTDYVFEHAAQYPEVPALVCGMTGRTYTYQMAQQLARW